MTGRAEIVPVEAFHVSEFIREEMMARGWDETDIAARMRGEPIRNLLLVQLLLAVRSRKLIVTDDISADLGQAFGVAPSFFARIDKMWREHPATIAAHQDGHPAQSTHSTAAQTPAASPASEARLSDKD